MFEDDAHLVNNTFLLPWLQLARNVKTMIDALIMNPTLTWDSKPFALH